MELLNNAMIAGTQSLRNTTQDGPRYTTVGLFFNCQSRLRFSYSLFLACPVLQAQLEIATAIQNLDRNMATCSASPNVLVSAQAQLERQ